MTWLSFDFGVTAVNGLLRWDSSTCTSIYMYEAAWRSEDKWPCDVCGVKLVAVRYVWLLILLCCQWRRKRTSSACLWGTTSRLSFGHSRWNKRGYFHKTVIDRNVIQQELNTTVGGQQILSGRHLQMALLFNRCDACCRFWLIKETLCSFFKVISSFWVPTRIGFHVLMLW